MVATTTNIADNSNSNSDSTDSDGNVGATTSRRASSGKKAAKFYHCKSKYKSSKPEQRLTDNECRLLRKHVLKQYKCIKFVCESQNPSSYLPFLENNDYLDMAFKAIGMDGLGDADTLRRARCWNLVAERWISYLRDIKDSKIGRFKDLIDCK